MLTPRPGESTYDPTCGTGGMLLAAVAHVRDRGGDLRTFFGKLFGQEKNLTTASVARMNLLLHGIEDFAVERGDTLHSPVFTDPASGGLATFDCVIANPPFSLEQWGREVWENDPWGRAFAGLPTNSSGDFAWVQNYLDPEHAQTILGWVRDFADVDDRARVVSVEEIQEEDWTLNISRYVLPPIGEDIPPLDEAVADFKSALARVREAEKELRHVMVEGGWLGA